jgi:hypothetical protein
VQALPPGSGLTLESRLAASVSGPHPAPAARLAGSVSGPHAAPAARLAATTSGAHATPLPPTPPAAAGPLQPDDTGDLSVLSSMRVFADLVVSGETGLLRFQTGAVTKDIYLVRGTPESLNSNQAADRFGDYLVARGFIRASDLERAYAQLPMFSGKLSDALVGLGSMKPVDLLRLQSQHVRERVIEIFTWNQGVFSFFRNQRNPTESSPLGLNSFEIMGASVLTMSQDFLQARFLAMADFRPHAAPQPRIALDTFRLGTSASAIWSLLDGKRTVRQLMTRYAGSPSDALTFMRVLYLLIESDLARLE